MCLNSETEIDSSDGSETKTSSEHAVRDNVMVPVDNTFVKVLQNMSFQLKVIKFVLGCVPWFDKETYKMKNL